MHIFFLTTGGTIDKDYPHTTAGWAFEFGNEPAVARLLNERLAFPRPSFSYEIIEVCRKDSLEIADEDREAVWKMIVECQRRQQEKAGANTSTSSNSNDKQEGRNDSSRDYGFVITHGTDTILQTGQYLQKKIESRQLQERQAVTTPKSPVPCIALTGAMRPERFSNSDAPVNVGMAVAAVQMMIVSGEKNATNMNDSAGGSVQVVMHGIVKPVNAMQRDNETGQFF